MSLPDFVEDWLPPGHHKATWEEIIAVFGGQPGTQRAKVLSNLLDWRIRVKNKGVSGRLLLNGSFISAREHPGDFDCLLIYDEQTEKRMNENAEVMEVLRYSYWKDLGYGDIWILSEEAVRKFPRFCRLDQFDEDKVTRKPKGIVEAVL